MYFSVLFINDISGQLMLDACKTGYVSDNIITHPFSSKQNHRKMIMHNIHRVLLSSITCSVEQWSLVAVLVKCKANSPPLSLLVHLEI